MWKVVVVGVLLVGVLYLATRPATPPKSTANASNSLLTLGAGVLAFAQKLSAPSKTPSLASSNASAAEAVSIGLPVSSTQGNGLATPSFLDGSSLVSAPGTDSFNAYAPGSTSPGPYAPSSDPPSFDGSATVYA